MIGRVEDTSPIFTSQRIEEIEAVLGPELDLLEARDNEANLGQPLFPSSALGGDYKKWCMCSQYPNPGIR